MDMQQQIESRLNTAFSPSHLEVVNETHMHNVPADAQSHFKVTVVSELFSGIPLIKQHRLVNEELKQELDNIHALALHTFDPERWQKKGLQAPDSPPCHGGSNA